MLSSAAIGELALGESGGGGAALFFASGALSGSGIAIANGAFTPGGEAGLAALGLRAGLAQAQWTGQGAAGATAQLKAGGGGDLYSSGEFSGAPAATINGLAQLAAGGLISGQGGVVFGWRAVPQSEDAWSPVRPGQPV